MTKYSAFMKKEWLESIRTYKLFILLCIFFVLACLSVFAAKFLPEIMSSFMPEGMQITISATTVFDAWSQFFKNITQIGLFAFVLVCSTMLVGEIKNKTCILLVAKGLPRKTIVLAKASTMILLWSIAYVVAILVTLLYSFYFWDMQAIPNLWISLLMVWIFGLLLISIILLGSVLFTSHYGGLLFCGIVLVFLMIINIVPAVQSFNPIQLISANMELLNETKEVADVFIPCMVSVGFTMLAMVMTCLKFDRQAL